MSSLNEEIKIAQAAAPPLVPAPAEVMDERPSGLLICLWDESEWVLPWSHFISARYQPRVKNVRRAESALDEEGQEVAPQNGSASVAAAAGDTVEQVELAFTYQRVVIHGNNLKPLIEAVADMSLWVVREPSSDFAEMQQEPVPEAEVAVEGRAVDGTGEAKAAREADESAVVITSINVQALEK